PLGDRKVLHVHLAGAAAAAGVHGAGLGHSPRPGQHVDLAAMLGVLRFTHDVANHDEHVNSHGSYSLPSDLVTSWPCSPHHPSGRALPQCDNPIWFCSLADSCSALEGDAGLIAHGRPPVAWDFSFDP